MRVRHARRPPEGGQRVDVAAGQRLGRPRRRSPTTSRAPRSGSISGDERQPVGHEAGADDQHALLAQRPQPARRGPAAAPGRGSGMLSCSTGTSAQRVHDLQRHPGAVVEAAAGVLVHRLGVRHQRGDLGGRARRRPAWRRSSRSSAGAKPPKSYTSGVPAAGADSVSGADSQCAETIRIARGLGIDCAQANSCASTRRRRSSGGAPWLRYSAGSGPSAGVQRAAPRTAAPRVGEELVVGAGRHQRVEDRAPGHDCLHRPRKVDASTIPIRDKQLLKHQPKVIE